MSVCMAESMAIEINRRIEKSEDCLYCKLDKHDVDSHYTSIIQSMQSIGVETRAGSIFAYAFHDNSALILSPNKLAYAYDSKGYPLGKCYPENATEMHLPNG